MNPVRQSTAFECSIGPVLDADGVAVTDGVVADFKIKKTTGNFAALNGSATLTHVSAGTYDLVLTASDLDTVGLATVAIDDGVNACAPVRLQVLEEAVYDALYAASAPGYVANAPVNMAQIGGDTQSATDLKDFADAGYDPSTNKVQGVVLVDTTTDLTNAVASVTGAVGSVTGNVGGNVTGTVASVVGNVGGNVTGSVGSVVGAVGSVTGAVGSVTGNVGGNVTGSVGSVVGAVGSVTGNVGGNVTGSVGSVVGAVGSVTGNVGGNVTGSVGSLATQAKADVNAEVLDVLNTDTFAEPGQGAPAATASLVAKIGYLFKAWRNRSTQTSSEYALYADDATTKDQEAAVSDNGTTYDRGEVGTGA